MLATYTVDQKATYHHLNPGFVKASRVKQGGCGLTTAAGNTVLTPSCQSQTNLSVGKMGTGNVTLDN